MRLRLTLTLTLPMMISAAAGLWEGSAPSQDSKPVSALLAHESDKAHIAEARLMLLRLLLRCALRPAYGVRYS